MKKEVYHLVTSGDTLFGLQKVACGIKPYEGMKGYLETGKVTCGACKRTKIFKKYAKLEAE